MTQIVVLAHGNFAVEALRSAEMILGKQENAYALSLNTDMSPDRLYAALNEVLGKSDDVLLLTDLLGGTPCNISLLLSKKRAGIKVGSGLNMPMLIAALTHNGNADERLKACLAAAKEGIMDVGEKSLA